MFKSVNTVHDTASQLSLGHDAATGSALQRPSLPIASPPISPCRLVTALHRLGVRHLATITPSPDGTPLSALTLLIGLANTTDARVRAALVPLFLWRPDYASAAQAASAAVSGEARTYLQCSYSAAVALEHHLADTLAGIARPEAPPLPDLFADELGLTALDSPQARLDEVARRHAELSGQNINWRGTYEHAVAAALRFGVPEIAWSR